MEEDKIVFKNLVDLSNWFKHFIDSVYKFLANIERTIGFVEYFPNINDKLWFKGDQYTFAVTYFRSKGLVLSLMKNESVVRPVADISGKDVWVLFLDDPKIVISCLVQLVMDYVAFLKDKDVLIEKYMNDAEFTAVIQKSNNLKNLLK